MPGTRSACLAAALLCLASTRSLAADPYADFRIPKHRWLSWSASASGGGSHDRSENLSGGLRNAVRISGTAGSSFTQGYDSDPLQFSYGLTSALSGGRSYSSVEDRQPGSSSDEINRGRNAGEALSGFAALSTYPWAAPVGLSLATAPSLELGQGWGAGDRTVIAPPFKYLTSNASTSGGYNVRADVSATLGFGRVRDATPVYQAQLLESRLLGTGALRRELSPAAREQLVALYTIEPSLAFAHQRPTKYFWWELERVLREDGALGPEGLDAYSVQRLLEPLSITGSAARRSGFFVGPQVSVVTFRFHSSTGFTSAQAQFLNDSLVFSSRSAPPRFERNDRRDFVSTGLSAEYHRPLGMRWQADGSTRALLSESGENLSLGTSLALTWLVSDRWYATTSFSHSAGAPGHGLERRISSWQTRFASSVSYFLEDAWSIGLDWRMDQFHGGTTYFRTESFAFGVTRRLAGLLDAVGIFQPMHLTRPAP